jgi:hypothetical protein
MDGGQGPAGPPFGLEVDLARATISSGIRSLGGGGGGGGRGSGGGGGGGGGGGSRGSPSPSKSGPEKPEKKLRGSSARAFGPGRFTLSR